MTPKSTHHVCTEAERLERIDSKIDRLISLQVETAVNSEKLENVNARIDDHEQRLKKIEAQPGKMVWLMGGGFMTIITGWILFLLKGGTTP